MNIPSAPGADERTEGPRWQRRPAERRQEIIAAARQVFGAEGYERATLAQVAKSAGVCAGTVSHYFGSKAELFEAMVTEEAFAELAGDESLLVAHRGSHRALLHELLGRMWRRMCRPGKPELVLTVLRELHAFPQSGQVLFRQLIERSNRVLAAVLEAGHRAGEFDVPDAEATAHLLGAAVLGITLELRFVAPCIADGPCADRALPALLAAADRIVGQGRATPTIRTE